MNELLELYKAFKLEMIDYEGESIFDGSVVHKLYSDDRIVAYMDVYDGWISSTYVLPEFRHRGLARRLVEEFVSIYGLPRGLGVVKKNKGSVIFWNSIFDLEIDEDDVNYRSYRILGLKRS